MKLCKSCGEVKPLTEFSRHKDMADGRQNHCKVCRAEWLRDWRAKNPHKQREYNKRTYERHGESRRAYANAQYAADPRQGARQYLAWRIRRDFGLTLDEYDAIVSQPCGLCGSTEQSVLDHDHLTHKVRGPLCQTCNKAIGMLGDDPARLRAAADYIERHRD